MDKVIKKNPRYANVESTLDTGSSMTKYLKKVEEIKSSNNIFTLLYLNFDQLN